MPPAHRRGPGGTPRSGGPTSRRSAAARRPDQRRRTAGTGSPTAQRDAPGGRLTTRAAVLGVIVCALLLALTVPMRQYLAQRARVARMEAAVAEQERRVAALEARKRRLQDPAYVEQLARERLHFVRPGEVPYILLTPSPAPTARVGGKDSPVVAPRGDQGPWFGRLWSTVDAAGRAAATVSPSPSPARR